VVRGQPLINRLYVPEPFCVDQRDAINARRRGSWAQAAGAASGVKPLMLLIAEVKEIVPARFGCKAVVKHVPDQGFAMDDGLYRRMAKRFARELSLWGATDELRMLMGATFHLDGAGVPVIDQLTLMLATQLWLPVENDAERSLVEQLVRDGRAFRKMLRYNLPAGQMLASAVLTDCSEAPLGLFVISWPHGSQAEDFGGKPIGDGWIWHPGEGTMPPLPPRVSSS
jgi:hypothetical protein